MDFFLFPINQNPVPAIDDAKIDMWRFVLSVFSRNEKHKNFNCLINILPENFEKCEIIPIFAASIFQIRT